MAKHVEGFDSELALQHSQGLQVRVQTGRVAVRHHRSIPIQERRVRTKFGLSISLEASIIKERGVVG